jgi:hypothetical protein
MIFGWDKQALGLGFLVAGSLAVLSVMGSAWMLRRRIASG